MNETSHTSDFSVVLNSEISSENTSLTDRNEMPIHSIVSGGCVGNDPLKYMSIAM